MKTILNILACILIYGSGAATGFVSARVYRNYVIKAPSTSVSDQTAIEIPSIRQIQQRLKDTGKKRYDCGVIDGKFGSKTKQALENYNCDQMAIQTFKPEYYGDKK